MSNAVVGRAASVGEAGVVLLGRIDGVVARPFLARLQDKKYLKLKYLNLCKNDPQLNKTIKCEVGIRTLR